MFLTWVSGEEGYEESDGKLNTLHTLGQWDPQTDFNSNLPCFGSKDCLYSKLTVVCAAGGGSVYEQVFTEFQLFYIQNWFNTLQSLPYQYNSLHSEDVEAKQELALGHPVSVGLSRFWIRGFELRSI